MITKKKTIVKKSRAKSNRMESDSVCDIISRINDIMDHEIAYEFLNAVAFKPNDIDITVKMEAQKHIKQLKKTYGEEIAQYTEEFYTETSQLRELLNQYNKLQKLEKRPCPSSIEICAEVEKLIEDDFFTEEEADFEEFTPPKGSRAAFLSIPDPITEFNEDGVNSLPETQQNILLEHYEDIFGQNLTYQDQIYAVISLIFIPGKKSVCGAAAIAKLFNVNRGTIYTHIKRMNKPKRETVGRPPYLDQQEQEILVAFIRSSYFSKNPTTYDVLSDFIFDKFSKVLSYDCLWHTLHNTQMIKTIPGHPMEASRADVPLEVIEDHFDRLQSTLSIEHIPPQFFFNIDESGFQQFVDARDVVLVVPSDAAEKEMCYSVNRNSKRATMIGCIAADGTALKPFVISPNRTVEKEIRTLGYRDDTVMIVSQENGFINAAIFAFWADMILFPEILRRRKAFNYTGTVVITMDGCSSHFSDYFLDECSYHGIYPFTEPPGTSDQVQPLDLGIFGNQKTVKKKSSRFSHLSENSQNIIEIVDSWQKATTPSNVVSAFNQAGIFIVNENGEEYVQASIEYARAVRGMEHKKCENIMKGSKTEKLPIF